MTSSMLLFIMPSFLYSISTPDSSHRLFSYSSNIIMSASPGTIWEDTLSDKYDPSTASPARFEEQWNALIKEQGIHLKMPKAKNSELKELGQPSPG